MKKFVCPVCGYVHEGEMPPEACPVCKVAGEKFTVMEEGAALAAEHEKLSEKIRSVEAQKKDKADRRRRIEVFLRMLEERAECMRFESYTFVALVDKVVVRQDGKLDFCFRNGMNYTK
mgnify:CR=1 FL=1